MPQMKLQLQPNACVFIGMVHVLPLPGSPAWGGSMQAVLDAAYSDAEALVAGGCDAILVENMGDLPYLRGFVHPETVAAMALATHTVCSVGLPTGVQILAGANREALGVATSTGASFIRAEAFAYAHVADEGILEASAGPLLRARRTMDSSVQIWADIKKKHASHSITHDLSLADVAKGHAFCGADALIVTGTSTGEPTQIQDVRDAKTAGLPVAVGSGVTPENIKDLAQESDALIVGSWIKKDGDWRNRVDLQRVQTLKQHILESIR